LVKEENRVSIASGGRAAHSNTQITGKVRLTELWHRLPREVQQRTLVTLSRIARQQLPPSLSEKEVKHEGC
jgi:hypothetical protein